MANVQVAVVIPVYNEEKNLPALMQRLMPYDVFIEASR